MSGNRGRVAPGKPRSGYPYGMLRTEWRSLASARIGKRSDIQGNSRTVTSRL